MTTLHREFFLHFQARRTLLVLALAWGATFLPVEVQAQSTPRERSSFNADWRFAQGDPADAGAKLDYSNMRAWMLTTGAALATGLPADRPEGNVGNDVSYTRTDFDDSQWRLLDLPHDWAIEGPFEDQLPGKTGKLPCVGVGWYRKHFTIPAGDVGNRVYLDIDGAMSYANVWLNGQYVGGWPYGYTSWRLDLTPHLKFGQENVLAIRLDNPNKSSRWYPGAGIYRNVWLVKEKPVHVAHWGTYLTTPNVTPESATLNVQVTVDNNSSADAEVLVETRLMELVTDSAHAPDASVAVVSKRLTVAAGEMQTAVGSTVITNPQLWDIGHPNLYLAVTTLKRGDEILDRYQTTFGIRTIHFDADRGFLLNGVPVELHGVCMHHDLGALGTAVNTRAIERQLEILREMGCNAIRTAHNPPAPELLDLCDRFGFLVIDEAFDTWQKKKNRNDYHTLFDDWHQKDLRAMIHRDRNHPCVILWSTGNEMPDQIKPEGIELSARLTKLVHEEDPTRLVTAGCNHDVAAANGFQKTLDVFGFNYKPYLFPGTHAANPDLPIIATESGSCVSSRGEYVFPVSDDKTQGRADFHVSSYDLYTPGWGWSPDREFRGQDENPYVAGEFVWSGFDYLGEPSPYNSDVTNLLNFTDPAERAQMQQELDQLGKIRVPSRSSYFGIVDLAGFKKDRFYLYQSRWRPDLPMAHILPHWNWPERLGEITPVHVYTSGDEAELFLNGKSLGRKRKRQYEYRFRWDDVAYEPGELQVVAYRDGKQWASDVMKTTGAPARLTLKVDRDEVRADGNDLAFVTVTVVDENGLMVPRSKNRIQFELEGPGDVIATDNGDQTDHEVFHSTGRNAFNGLALAIVRTRDGEPGRMTLKASSDGLDSATIRIESRAAD